MTGQCCDRLSSDSSLIGCVIVENFQISMEIFLFRLIETLTCGVDRERCSSSLLTRMVGMVSAVADGVVSDITTILGLMALTLSTMSG